MTRSIFSSYEQASTLRRLNPTIKLAVTLTSMLVATLLFDFWTLLLIALTTLALVWWLGRVPLVILLRVQIPFLVLGLGYLWMNALFARGDPDGLRILFAVGPLQVSAEGIDSGLILLARALCFGASSLFFVTTTDPTDLILSLIQQLRLSPRLAYSILAVYRFLPLLESELRQIQAAHHLRGIGEGKGLRVKAEQSYRYTIPLLANAVRRANRVAIAMESRAFSGTRQRSYYRQLHIGPVDWVALLCALAALAVILFLSWQLGWLRFWRGNLEI
jgi:energy-coupling factor transport system permease protein